MYCEESVCYPCMGWNGTAWVSVSNFYWVGPMEVPDSTCTQLTPDSECFDLCETIGNDTTYGQLYGSCGYIVNPAACYAYNCSSDSCPPFVGKRNGGGVNEFGFKIVGEVVGEPIPQPGFNIYEFNQEFNRPYWRTEEKRTEKRGEEAKRNVHVAAIVTPPPLPAWNRSLPAWEDKDYSGTLNGFPILAAFWPVYMGCYADNYGCNSLSCRDISGAQLITAGAITSITSCVDFCSGLGYPWLGVQAGTQCFCGDSYNHYGNSTLCTIAGGYLCSSGDQCGGWWANGVYSTGFVGCWTETSVPGKHDLPYQYASSWSNLTVAICRNGCDAHGYAYAAMQNGHDCFCGNGFGNKTLLVVQAGGDCKTACAGNSAEYCGGSSHNSIFTAQRNPAIESGDHY